MSEDKKTVIERVTRALHEQHAPAGYEWQS